MVKIMICYLTLSTSFTRTKWKNSSMCKILSTQSIKPLVPGTKHFSGIWPCLNHNTAKFHETGALSIPFSFYHKPNHQTTAWKTCKGNYTTKITCHQSLVRGSAKQTHTCFAQKGFFIKKLQICYISWILVHSQKWTIAQKGELKTT